jgi:hypothetical protein
MSTAGEAEENRARGVQPTPEGPVRARGSSPTRWAPVDRYGAKRANRRARRGPIEEGRCAKSRRVRRRKEAE